MFAVPVIIRKSVRFTLFISNRNFHIGNLTRDASVVSQCNSNREKKEKNDEKK